MTSFEMVKYHGQGYPLDIPLRIEEIAAHFDVSSISGKLNSSLHTEYSYGKRKFDSALVSKFPEILAAQKDSVPQLWKNEFWALQFADFLIELVGEKPAPCVIEIHPPFNDYSDIASFIQAYKGFEAKIKEHFPEVEILIENRCGSVYHGGKFILSKLTDLDKLCEAICSAKLTLKVAYDVPQIYTAYNVKTGVDYIKLLEDTKQYRQYIGGVHLWGKRLSDSGAKGFTLRRFELILWE